MDRLLRVITPVSHINGLLERLSSMRGVLLDLKEECEVSDILGQSNTYAIYTNPNSARFTLNAKLLDTLPNLEVICTASTGTVHIDMEYCKSRGISVLSLTNQRKVINRITSTAEHALALTLASIRNIYSAQSSVIRDEWDYTKFIGRQFSSLTVGVVGYGRLGQLYSQYVKALGARVIVYDPYQAVYDPNIDQVEALEELVVQSDIISLHVHVTHETRCMISKRILEKAKKSLLLVNTSRGEIVDENDLIEFLKNNKNASYATDVLTNESTDRSISPILKYQRAASDQILVTPHIGGMTVDAQEAAYHHACSMLENFLCHKL